MGRALALRPGDSHAGVALYTEGGAAIGRTCREGMITGDTDITKLVAVTIQGGKRWAARHVERIDGPIEALKGS